MAGNRRTLHADLHNVQILHKIHKPRDNPGLTFVLERVF